MKKSTILISVFVVLIAVIGIYVFFNQEDTKNNQPITEKKFTDSPDINKEIMPWTDQSPYPYSNEDKALVDASYTEDFKEMSLDNIPVLINKAKNVFKQWGRDPNEYEIQVFESPNFFSVTFYPNDLAGHEQHVEIRITKKDFFIVSILPGS